MYTFSAYVKTSGLTVPSGARGAYITAFPNGNTFVSRETISASTVDSNANCFLSGWQRISVTFPVTASASGTSFNIRFQSSAKSGTVWFAAPQVEKGDIVGLIDSTGALVVEYKYDAWGNPVSTRTLTSEYDALAELNPFRYRGYVWDTDTERYYVSSRYYKPKFIRWSNADGYVSTGQGSSDAICMLIAITIR